MLDPDLVLSAFVSTVRSIPELITELGGDPSLISGHYYLSGTENSLTRAIYSMPAPSILIAYLDLLGGNFSGATLWKHRFEIYVRPKNAAIGGVGPNGTGPPAASALHLIWLMFNKPVLGGVQHIRGVSILDPDLYPMDTPTILRRNDEEGQDFFVVGVTIPEAGDA